jgi:hypothetical protein
MSVLGQKRTFGYYSITSSAIASHPDKTSDGRSMRIGISAPTLVPTVSTKNGATHDTNLDDLAMSEVSPLPESDTEFVAC